MEGLRVRKEGLQNTDVENCLRATAAEKVEEESDVSASALTRDGFPLLPFPVRCGETGIAVKSWPRTLFHFGARQILEVKREQGHLLELGFGAKNKHNSHLCISSAGKSCPPRTKGVYLGQNSYFFQPFQKAFSERTFINIQGGSNTFSLPGGLKMGHEEKSSFWKRAAKRGCISNVARN